MKFQNAAKTSPEQKRIIWIIFGAFVAAIPIYVFVYVSIFAQMYAEGSEILPEKMATIIFGGISLMSIVFGFLFANLIPIKPRNLESVTLRVIVTSAFFESIAIYGLIGRIIGLPSKVSYALFAVALVTLLINGARVSSWIQECEESVWRGSQ